MPSSLALPPPVSFPDFVQDLYLKELKSYKPKEVVSFSTLSIDVTLESDG
jgi:hypothetical protein